MTQHPAPDDALDRCPVCHQALDDDGACAVHGDDLAQAMQDWRDERRLERLRENEQ